MAGERAAQLIAWRVEDGAAILNQVSASLNAIFTARETTGIALTRARKCAS
jgi:hypothetical protein